MTLAVGYLLPVTFPNLVLWGLVTCWAITSVLFLLGLRMVWRKVEKPKDPETLREHFEQDFKLMSIRREITASVKGRQIPLSVQVHLDFTGGCDFASVYIPRDSESYTVATLMLTAVREARESMLNDVKIGAREPGQLVTTQSRDLMFTNKVFLYHEDEYSLRQTADLVDAYRAGGLQLELRSQSFVTARWLSSRAVQT